LSHDFKMTRRRPAGAGGAPPATDLRWEHFAHGADLGLRGYGASLSEAFAAAALALTGAVTDPAQVAAGTAVAIEAEAPDDELLLVDWLNALIYEMSVRRMLFARFEVAIADRRLTATAWGEPVDVARHKPAVEPKGATYTCLHVGRAEDGRWVAECVIDV
jgi:SHS2 domain-containing protein